MEKSVRYDTLVRATLRNSELKIEVAASVRYGLKDRKATGPAVVVPADDKEAQRIAKALEALLGKYGERAAVNADAAAAVSLTAAATLGEDV